ncbi:MAG: M20 aminoacylase family protein [Pseudomonadota bacterium]
MVRPEDIRSMNALIDFAVDLRRDIHKHPETAFEEVRTASLVADRLRELGLEVHTGLAQTGVVGILEGRRPGPRTIGLRADMDALFIREETGRPYQSTVDGKMHACGHDGHTAMLLGAAEYLTANNDFEGRVAFIFQPAEESEGGARVMVEEGLFEQFPCDAVYGLHNLPGQPVGTFVTTRGPFCAAGDTWQVDFNGSGGHGAFPHKATDPTAALGAFLTAYQMIVARKVPPHDAAILSIGLIEGGHFSSPNIIPSTVRVRGTARSFQPAIRDILETGLRSVATDCAALHGCQADATYIRRYPPVVNHDAQTDIAVAAAIRTAGQDAVEPDAPTQGGSEDFSFMLQKVPGCFMMIGNGGGPDASFVHTPTYDFNDDVIPHGVAYWINVVGQELGSKT